MPVQQLIDFQKHFFSKFQLNYISFNIQTNLENNLLVPRKKITYSMVQGLGKNVRFLRQRSHLLIT